MISPQIGELYATEILTQPWMYVDEHGVKRVRTQVVYFVRSVVLAPPFAQVGARLRDMVRQQAVRTAGMARDATQSRGAIQNERNNHGIF